MLPDYFDGTAYARAKPEHPTAGKMPGFGGVGARELPSAKALRPEAAPVPGKKEFDRDRPVKVVLGIVIALLFLVVIGEIVFQVFVAPGVKLKKVLIDSDLAYSADFIKEKLGLNADSLYYSLDEKELRKQLLALPQIKDAAVERVFPDELRIRLVSRRALASALIKEPEGQRPVLLDEEGVVFAYGDMAGIENLPVLSGMEFRNFRLGIRLPGFIIPFLRDLSELREKKPALFSAFSEFKLVPVGPENLEILGFSVASSVPVRLSPRFSEETALYILRTIDMLESTGFADGIKELDFRTQNLVYRKGDE